MNNCSLFCLCGRTAIVTGAAGGIGTATAHNLANQGADLIFIDIKEKELKEIADNIKSKYNKDDEMEKKEKENIEGSELEKRFKNKEKFKEGMILFLKNPSDDSIAPFKVTFNSETGEA